MRSITAQSGAPDVEPPSRKAGPLIDPPERQRAQKAPKPPKPRKVERRRRGRKG